MTTEELNAIRGKLMEGAEAVIILRLAQYEGEERFDTTAQGGAITLLGMAEAYRNALVAYAERIRADVS